jgi:hypothetical protein
MLEPKGQAMDAYIFIKQVEKVQRNIICQKVYDNYFLGQETGLIVEFM